MITVYAISSINRKYIYVGMTNNLERRLYEHNHEKEQTTRPYAPFKLIHSEVAENRIYARKREKYFKSGVGKEFLKSLL